MAKKLMAWKTKGMNRDLSVSAFNPEFSFENINLRLSTNEGNTMMSWVNERSTGEIKLYVENSESTTTLNGTVIGTAVLNHQLVLFTTDTNADYIYRLKYRDNERTMMSCFVLYSKKLSFDVEHPLQTLVSYESETIQKVYWVDGKNQPRVINIAVDNSGKDATAFDFVRELQLKEDVSVEKQLGATGMFAPGVIQYAFTYYDKYGQESNIFYVTPLYYISNADRGVSPEGKVENAFKITVSNIDKNFEYLRIYSIQRTSIDATPICKRIQDIAIKDLTGTSASYVDNGFSGDSVDPTELLFKSNDEITAETIEQKDGTLFLGNLSYISKMNEAALDTLVSGKITDIADSTRSFTANEVTKGNYPYANQLTSTSGNKTVPCGGFKAGDYYRLGVQFQYKTGKWSKPVFIKDHQVSINSRPSISDNTVYVPTISGKVSSELGTSLIAAGYKKVRAVVVFPEMQDRVTICQGVINPTLWTKTQREKDKNLYAQSSWFFRPKASTYIGTNGTVAPSHDFNTNYVLPYADKSITWNPVSMRRVEIQGHFEFDNKYQIDETCVTFHSPDVEFDTALSVLNYSGLRGREVGYAGFLNTLSDIDIQTESPTISNSGAGFTHKSFVDGGSRGIASGLFYDDYLVDDWEDRIGKDEEERSPFKWMVYLWNKSGSLNNDFLRPADKGTQTAKLKKKIVSNLRVASNTTYNSNREQSFNANPQLFSSDQVTILKLANNEIYQGNIDTMLVPDHSDGMYFCHDSEDWQAAGINTSFTCSKWYKTFSTSEEVNEDEGLYKWGSSRWERIEGYFGDYYLDLVMRKEGVRVKYKSTPHLVFRGINATWGTDSLPVWEVIRGSVDTNQLFGGQTNDAFRENKWLPCGEPKQLSSTGTTFSWEYGDTYYQRWDCLKTYAFTPEDVNQVVEIGSFMLETRVNIDGRYDRNRGQMNNLNMSPINFNLMNMVYSQRDNFFTYRIMDDDHYKNLVYPNQITWTLSKNSGDETDKWTSVNMASVLELDGDKGKINKLIRLNNQLFCFQDTGISHILYNENVQIQSTQGVPIEIANSGKVQGKDYKSGSVGCSNKWSMVAAPLGIYFMDDNNKSIYMFNGQLANISTSFGFNSWAKNNIPPTGTEWNPVDFANFRSFYDMMNQEVMFVNKEKALAFSEKVNAFTSFYSYEDTPFFCNLDDTGVWVKANGKLWKHHGGTDYCRFFGAETTEPYSMTLIGNPEPQTDKTFTNLEFRANVDAEGSIVNRSLVDTFDETFDYTFHPDPNAVAGFEFFLPFDSLEVWDEYQHGIATLSQKNGRGAMQHSLSDGTSHLARKFRMWRCDVPRNNYPLPTSDEETLLETQRGIFRKIRNPNDRMRNPWLYLKLTKSDDTSKRTEIHDLIMTYFN